MSADIGGARLVFRLCGDQELRLRRRRRIGRAGAVAALGHELIELGLVAGEAQPLEEFLELALLFFETPQRLGAVFVEGMVAARRPEPAGGVLHRMTAVGAAFTSSPTAHASAPYDIGQDRETHRPPQEESEDHQRNPCAHAPLIKFDLSICDRCHVPSSVLCRAVNVNNIYIASGGAAGCQGSFLRPEQVGSPARFGSARSGRI